MNNQYQLYFAYGSNLNYSQMKKRCHTAEVVSRARKLNHKLCFPIISKNRGNMGVASIKKSKGNTVEGVIYSISNKDLQTLDKFEASGHRYKRKKVFVNLNEDKKKLVWTYIAISDHVENYLPSDSYLNLIISGAKEHRLPKKYIERIKKGVSITHPFK